MKEFEVRYPSEIADGYALYDTYKSYTDAMKAAASLKLRFAERGLKREAKGVTVR